MAFFVDYGQDNLDREFACARINTQHFGVPMEVVNIRSLRESFIVNHVVESFTDNEHFKLMLPFGKTNRSEVIKIGQRLGVDYVNTWSCHENTSFPCNRCEGCEERREAFSLAGAKDPQLEAGGIKVPVRANKTSVPI